MTHTHVVDGDVSSSVGSECTLTCFTSWPMTMTPEHRRRPCILYSPYPPLIVTLAQHSLATFTALFYCSFLHFARSLASIDLSMFGSLSPMPFWTNECFSNGT